MNKYDKNTERRVYREQIHKSFQNTFFPVHVENLNYEFTADRQQMNEERNRTSVWQRKVTVLVQKLTQFPPERFLQFTANAPHPAPPSSSSSSSSSSSTSSVSSPYFIELLFILWNTVWRLLRKKWQTTWILSFNDWGKLHVTTIKATLIISRHLSSRDMKSVW